MTYDIEKYHIVAVLKGNHGLFTKLLYHRYNNHNRDWKQKYVYHMMHCYVFIWQAAKSFEVYPCYGFSHFLFSNREWFHIVAGKFCCQTVLESLSNKTSQFEEVIFCYVNNISGFWFISTQVLCTSNRWQIINCRVFYGYFV